ncbi:hypothetical protein WR30_34235 [Burkholderia contaminans FFH2055]|nr:hypothetical protein WR30_34235 [Burkholderia contaminans FFH2055]
MAGQIGGPLSVRKTFNFEPGVVFVTAESWTQTYSSQDIAIALHDLEPKFLGVTRCYSSGISFGIRDTTDDLT